MTRVDAMLAVVVFGVASWVGTQAVRSFRAAGGAQYFYQSDFGPAVMVACGRPMADPDTMSALALGQFLTQRSDRLDCADLPAELATRPMNPFQAGIRYLQLAVAMTWKATGVSWPRLDVLNGVMFGATAAMTFLILRLGLALLLALALLVPSVTSTPNLMLVPQLRDYAKGPFLLAAIAIMGMLVTRAHSAKRVVALATIGAIVIGVGLGFRADLIIAVPPFVIALALLVPRHVTARQRFVAVILFLVITAGVAWPILRVGGGSNNGHVTVLGFVSDFDGPLRIEPSIYTFGGPYIDSLAATTINAYGIRVEGRAAANAMSAEYEHLAAGYLREVVTTFPADIVTRAFAAVRTVSKYSLDSSLYPPLQVRAESWRAWYPLRARVLWRLGELAFVACVAATLLVSAVHPRAAWLMVVVMVGFAGASAIQFNERHFYYLQFVPWLAFGLLAQAASDWRTHLAATTRRHVMRAAVFAAIVFGGVATAILFSRALQQQSVRRLFARYASAPRTPILTSAQPEGADRTLLTAPEWLAPLPAGTPAFRTRLVAVDFRDQACGAASVPMTIRYDGRRRDADLSETIHVRPHADAGGHTTAYIVAYDWSTDYVRFRGIELPADRVNCIAGVSRVAGLEHEPLLVTSTLGAGWAQEKLYQRFQ